MEYRLTFTLAGVDPERHDVELLDAFIDAHPEVGPIVSADLKRRTLAVTFSFDAEDAQDAVERGRAIFDQGIAASGLQPTRIIGIEAGAVPDEELADFPEPQPA